MNKATHVITHYGTGYHDSDKVTGHTVVETGEDGSQVNTFYVPSPDNDAKVCEARAEGIMENAAKREQVATG